MRRKSGKVMIELPSKVVDMLEDECHRRDCTMDTLIAELVDISKMEKRRGV